MIIKKYCVIILLLISLSSKAQINRFSLLIGQNFGFKSSINSITPVSIYKYDKNNNGGHDLISFPNINVGINYEYAFKRNFSIFIGVHSVRNETELIFENFKSSVDNGSYVKYGYSINTFEFPIGIVNQVLIANKFYLKNYLALTINMNGLSQGVYSYRLIQNSNTDTTRLRFTDIDGFPNGNSLGIRYGIGVIPFKKFNNLEIGVYLNLQFNYTLTWEQEVEFENISQNTYEYYHAILRDKIDYINFHIKYNFWKI